MLQSIINRASDALHHTISRYVSRLIVSVPVVVAAAFATAAAATELSARYGATMAYIALAGFFAVVALIAAAVMSARDRTPPEPTTAAIHVRDDAPKSAADAASQLSFDPAMLLVAGRLAGPAAETARALLRNWPLVIGVVVLAWLLLSETREPDEPSVAEPAE